MTSNSSLSVIALDFITLRNSLSEYMQGLDAFQDYDFLASNLSQLLDILAVNGFNIGFYLNMVQNEMFLDSAVLRNSVVSNAKDLNYTPRSNLSATANVNVKITTTDGSMGVVIPQFTTFTGRIGSNTFTFSTNTAVTAVSNTNVINALNVQLFEGIINNDQFVVDYSNTSQRFVLSDSGIDTSSLVVSVVEDGGSNNFNYLQATSLFDLNANSEVYFIQASSIEEGKYELIFGDNVTGRRPKDAAIIVATYRVSTGDIPNGISSFSVDGPIGGHANVIITVNRASQGGSYAEGIESIRFNAPRHFTTQERCVTADDYEVLLHNNFPEILDVSAVGGEELDPPQYAKVAITVALDGIDGLPDSKVKEYTDFLSPRSPLGITPIFTEADYLYVGVDSVVNYNVNVTEVDASYIETVVLNQITAYNDVAINGFKKTLRYSQLLRTIDRADSSIVSNSTDLKMIKRIEPTLGLPQSYTFSFDQELAANIQGSQSTIISSDKFIYQNQTVQLQDDGAGNINLVATAFFSETVLFKVGVVDYTTGKITLNNLKVDLLPSNLSYLQIFATSKYKDILSKNNVVLAIDPLNINITVNQERV